MITTPKLDLHQDHWMALPAVQWEQFEAIAHAFETIPGVKLAYLDGVVEIMTTGDEHEDLKKTIALLLEALHAGQGHSLLWTGGSDVR